MSSACAADRPAARRPQQPKLRRRLRRREHHPPGSSRHRWRRPRLVKGTAARLAYARPVRAALTPASLDSSSRPFVVGVARFGGVIGGMAGVGSRFAVNEPAAIAVGRRGSGLRVGVSAAACSGCASGSWSACWRLVSRRRAARRGARTRRAARRPRASRLGDAASCAARGASGARRRAGCGNAAAWAQRSRARP